MYTSFDNIVVGLAILSTATTATAVQLASFTPRVDISNTQCRAAYTTNIDGCTANDFAANARCSSACLQGLVKIGEVVKRVCKDVDLGETSIIGVFQNDLGLAALCPGTSLSTSTSSSTTSTKAAPQTSAQPPSSRAVTTSTLATSTSTSTSSTSTSTSQSEGSQPSSTSSRALVYDPNPTSIAETPTSTVQPPARSSTEARPTQPGNAQLSNADSGGGSPFDVQAVNTSSRSQAMNTIVILGIAMLLIACA